MRALSFLGSLVIGLGACSNVVALNPAASAVTVSKDAPAGCKDLGEVFGKSNDDEQEAAMSGARNDIKSKAHAMGANYVVLETNNASEVKGNFKPGVEILLGGRALACSGEPAVTNSVAAAPSPAPAAAPSPTPAAAPSPAPAAAPSPAPAAAPSPAPAAAPSPAAATTAGPAAATTAAVAKPVSK